MSALADDGGGEETAGSQGGLLGPSVRPVGDDETVLTLAADCLLETLCRMGTRQVLMHELHLGAPVRNDVLVDGAGRLGGLDVQSDHARTRAHAATSDLRGRPRGLLRGTTTPWTNHSPPQTPQGSARSSAPARQSRRAGQVVQSDLAYSTSAGESAKNSSGSLTRQGSCSSATRSARADRPVSAVRDA